MALLMHPARTYGGAGQLQGLRNVVRRAMTRVGWLGALWAAGVFGVTACGSAPSPLGTADTGSRGAAAASVAAFDSQTTTSAAVLPSQTTLAPTTTVPVPANLVHDCVAY